MKKWIYIIVLFASVPLGAVNYTWLGTDNSWSNPANWSPAGVPGVGDAAAFSAATPADPVLQSNISISGFTASGNHIIVLNGFTLSVTSASNVTIANTTIGLLVMSGGTFIVTAPAFTFSSTDFQASVVVSKTGAALASSSGCSYNGNLTWNNNAAGTIRSGDVALPDVFSGDFTINNNNGGSVQLAYSTAGNQFNGNIWMNQPNGGTISFGVAGGTSTLANSFVVAEGATGVTRGTLDLRNFTQVGNTPQTIDMSWGGPLSASQLVLTIGPSVTFNGDVNFVASNLLITGTTFNGSNTALMKVVNGGSLNVWNGGNIFNSSSTIITNATGISEIRMGVVTPDVFNGSVRFHRSTSGGIISPAYNGVNVFNGDVIVSSNYVVGPGTPVIFGTGNGVASFQGALPQNVTRLTPAMAAPVFNRVEIVKSANNVTLNTPVNVAVWMDLQTGLVTTTAANILTLLAGATTNIGNTASFVSGPMNCQVALAGNSNVIFPIGKPGEWRPAVLNVTHSDAVNVTYTGEMIPASAAALGYTMPPTVSNVSAVRYWIINRQSVANLVTANAVFYYDLNDGVTNYPALTVVKTIGAGTVWYDIGGTATSNGTGCIVSGNFSTFSTFALGNLVGGTNPLPIELVSFTGWCDGGEVLISWTTATETNNDLFTLEFSQDGMQFQPIAAIDGAGTSDQVHHYSYLHVAAVEGTGFYRLRQTDFNGSSTVSSVIAVSTEECTPRQLTLIINTMQTDYLEVIVKGPGDHFTVDVFASDGRMMSHQDVNGTSPSCLINTSNWDSGVYWVRVSDGNSFKVKEIVR